MLADSGSESGCGRLKVHPQSEQRPVCWPLSLALSSMVLSTTTVGEEGVSFFDTSESDTHIMFMFYSGARSVSSALLLLR